MAKYSIVAGIKIATEFVPETFGRLTTIGPVFYLTCEDNRSRPWQVCECECGKVTVTKVKYLRNKDTRSCGCLHTETAGNRYRQHGQASTAEYRAWNAARIRCNSTDDVTYILYGGRGIKMCDRWQEPDGQGYLNFLADMGRKPSPKHSLDRIDVNGDYCPENCRWATVYEQQNNRRNNRRLEAFGRIQTLAEWAREHDVPPHFIDGRLSRGWTLERALTEPKKQTGRKPKPK